MISARRTGRMSRLGPRRSTLPVRLEREGSKSSRSKTHLVGRGRPSRYIADIVTSVPRVQPASPGVAAVNQRRLAKCSQLQLLQWVHCSERAPWRLCRASRWGSSWWMARLVGDFRELLDDRRAHRHMAHYDYDEGTQTRRTQPSSLDGDLAVAPRSWTRDDRAACVGGGPTTGVYDHLIWHEREGCG